jgi:hypothetical protein
MEKQLNLTKELAELSPLVGKWTIKGNFKNNPTKFVEGWEIYSIEDKGSVLHSKWETITLWPEKKDIYKGDMKIVYNKKAAKIIGGDEWLFSINKAALLIENSNMRFTGEINKSKDTIIGKWEAKDKTGHWGYWYDKVLTRMRIPSEI